MYYGTYALESGTLNGRNLEPSNAAVAMRGHAAQAAKREGSHFSVLRAIRRLPQARVTFRLVYPAFCSLSLGPHVLRPLSRSWRCCAALTMGAHCYAYVHFIVMHVCAAGLFVALLLPARTGLDLVSWWPQFHRPFRAHCALSSAPSRIATLVPLDTLITARRR